MDREKYETYAEEKELRLVNTKELKTVIKPSCCL
jgi:hypothetical protein